jgi:hypothetical protein
MLSKLDKEALDHAFNLIANGADKEAARRLKQIAKEDGWTAAAERASHWLQVTALNLRPYECPPCRARAGGKGPESRLLYTLLAQGFSRYTADPTIVLAGHRPEPRDKHPEEAVRSA